MLEGSRQLRRARLNGYSCYMMTTRSKRAFSPSIYTLEVAVILVQEYTGHGGSVTEFHEIVLVVEVTELKISSYPIRNISNKRDCIKRIEKFLYAFGHKNTCISIFLRAKCSYYIVRALC